MALIGLLFPFAASNAFTQPPGPAAPPTPAASVVLENDCLKWEITAEGRTLHLVDKATGIDYVKPATDSCVASVRKAGRNHNASKISYESGRLAIAFADCGVRAILRPKIEKRYLTLEVVSVDGDPVEEMTFLYVPLALKGALDEPFACCALALNLKTNVPEIPGPNSLLRAMCYPRFGLRGAQVALIACPQKDLRDVMKEAVAAAEDLPRSNLGGPWALDAEINRGSYLFDFGSITEATVDQWIDLVKALGLNQIDFHTGSSLRFGDCAPNPKLFPNGRASVKAVLDKLHAAGIAAGLHTYAFFIAKDTPYVTPIPDPRLGKDATFTLAEPLTPEANTVPVAEPTKDMSALTGFFVRNSVTLQIDDELVTYSGIAKEPPYAFTGCARGACGTKPAAHDNGAKVAHLKECFGLFTPDADSTLLAEVARNQAETFNECGFDMMYLDALDGEDILAGGENAWHYGSKFVFEIAKRLQKPALFEMSTFHHHLWCVRARMGAWDHPTRSHKRFIDVHCAANLDGAKTFLPMNLGWWAVQVWNEGNPTQTEPTFPDDIEYLMGKCLGADMGISLMGVNPDTIASIPAYQRLAPIFRQYEELRHAKYFPEPVKARLRQPGKEFTLEQGSDGKWQFRPVQYDRHKVQGLDGWSNLWTAQDPFASQSMQLRIEALMAAAAYDATESVVIEDFAKLDAYTDRGGEVGVTADLVSSTAQLKTGPASGCFTATSSRDNADGAWARIGKQFSPPLNIANQKALGAWVYGDGQGELLNLQLRSPQHTVNLGMGDHYARIDFTGWRYFALIEMEGGRIADYAWPYRGDAYAVYRESVDYGQVETLALWYNLLPKDKPVTCYISPVKALPLVKTKLANPTITIAGKTIVFPVEIESGSYLEFRSMTDCKLYGSKGELVRDVAPQGDVPALEAGDNRVEFACDPPQGMNPRAYVTIITRGEPFRE
jgi:hypothetical protein